MAMWMRKAKNSQGAKFNLLAVLRKVLLIKIRNLNAPEIFFQFYFQEIRRHSRKI